MSGIFKRRLAAICAVALASTGGLLIVARTEAASGPKAYTASADTQTLSAGTQSASITFKNTSRNRIAFSAINVTVPTGLTVTAPLVSQAGASAQMNGSNTVIELRNLNIDVNASVTLTFTVVASVQSTCTAYTFVSDVRQSNDFNGQNNSFALDGGYASMTGPCSSATVICVVGDNKACTTGIIQSTNGNTASVLVNDGDGISATLTASLIPANFTCVGYEPTSDRLNFDVAITVGSLTNVTKTVTFTQAIDTTKTYAWQYQACFQAPYAFPALLPSQLAQDFATGNFSGNTVHDPSGGTYTGLLLPCSAGYGVPCLGNPLNFAQPGVIIAGGRVSLTVTVPALDPGMRF